MSERRAAHHAAYQTKRTGRAGSCAPGTAQTAQNAPAALCAAAGAGGPCPAWHGRVGAALPRRLDDALAQHYAAQMSVMQRELFALRRRLAEHEPDAEENAALRNFFCKAGRRTANAGTPCGPPPAGLADFAGAAGAGRGRRAGPQRPFCGHCRGAWHGVPGGQRSRGSPGSGGAGPWHADPPERSPVGDRPALQL